MLSLVRFYGTPSLFITVTPYEVDSVVVLRLATYGKDDAYDMSLPLPSFGARSKLALDNAVAVAIAFKRTIEAVLEHALGLKAVHERMSTVPVCDRPVGVLGKTVAYAVVIEEQTRKRGHGHAVVFGAVSPAVVRQAIDDFELRRRVCAFLRLYRHGVGAADGG